MIKMQYGESPPEMKSCFLEQVDEAYHLQAVAEFRETLV